VVENTGVLGLGFNPNRHNQEKKISEAIRSGARGEHGRATRCWLADAYTHAGVWVTAQAGVTQD
jgi:hypothetical protein